MLKKLLITFGIAASFGLAQSGPGNPMITTGQYNSNRTSANSNEAILNPTNVNANSNQFGRLFSWAVDGQIFAQPLYVPGVTIGGKVRNVVYVATMHNSVYAFDSANQTGTPLWKKNFGTPVSAASNTNSCPSSNFTGPELGILGTPVIDQSTNTIYFVSASPVSGGYKHSIHALDLVTGNEKFGGPQQIQASVPGTGYNNQNGTVTLGPNSTEVQRSALLLANGHVYAAFGNCGPDADPWHGWLVGYSASNLQSSLAPFNTTPNGGQGGIWQSARGLVVDATGSIYFTTGNATPNGYGTVTTGDSGGDAAKQNYAMRLMQMSPGGQFLSSYPPQDYQALNNNDLDFSSSGPLLIPGTNLMLAGGKDGVMYLFNTSNIGSPIQSFTATGGASCTYTGDGCDQIHDLAFWNNNLYLWGSNDVLRSFQFQGGQFNPTTAYKNTITTGYRPATLAVSANGAQGGIVWSTTPTNILHAFDANNVGVELWNSNMNSQRDALPSYARFVEPTIANGRVYVATASNQLVVYGLLSEFTLSTSTSSQIVLQGGSASFGVSVSAVSGLSNPVNLSVAGLPAGATANFNPASVSGSGSSTVTINTSSSTPTGTSNLIITGTEGGESRTASLQLIVTTADTTPPQATCCTYTIDSGAYTLHFTGQDAGSGLKSIIATQKVNATASIPAFTAGTKDVVNFTASESGWGSYISFQLTDVAGNKTNIDPFFLDFGREPGQPVANMVKIKPQERWLTVVNGTPGLKNVSVDVAAGLIPKHIEIAGMKDGEIRIVDLSSYLPVLDLPILDLPSSLQDTVTVSITPRGKPGGTALFCFSDTNDPNQTAAASNGHGSH